MSEQKQEKVRIALSDKDRKVVSLLRSKVVEATSYQRGAADTANALFQQYLMLLAQEAGYKGGQLKLAEDDSALVEEDSAPVYALPTEPPKDVEPSK